MSRFKSLILMFMVLMADSQASNLNFDPQIRETCLKTRFLVRPAWDRAIQSLVSDIRSRITSAHKDGFSVGYISLPLRANNQGGIKEFNIYLGELQRKKLLSKGTLKDSYIILPGQPENSLPAIEGVPAGGSEYMYMWTQVLAGEGCQGGIDWVYFMDSYDIPELLNPSLKPSSALMEALSNLALRQPDIYKEIYSSPDQIKDFLSFYLNHYGVQNSKGVSDEWNIIQMLNSRRYSEFGINQGFKGIWSKGVKSPVPRGHQQNPVVL